MSADFGHLFSVTWSINTVWLGLGKKKTLLGLEKKTWCIFVAVFMLRTSCNCVVEVQNIP